MGREPGHERRVGTGDQEAAEAPESRWQRVIDSDLMQSFPDLGVVLASDSFWCRSSLTMRMDRLRSHRTIFSGSLFFSS